MGRREWWESVLSSAGRSRLLSATPSATTSAATSDSEDGRPPQFGPPATDFPTPTVYYTDEFARNLPPSYATPSRHQLSFEVETPRVWSPEEATCSWLDRSSPITFTRSPLIHTTLPRPSQPHQYANLPGPKEWGVYENAGSHNNIYANCTLPRSSTSGYNSASPATKRATPHQTLERLGVGTIDRSRAVTFRRVEKVESEEIVDPERLIDRLYASLPPRSMPLPPLPPSPPPDHPSFLPTPVVQRLRSLGLKVERRDEKGQREEQRRTRLFYASIVAVIFILFSLLLLHMIPPLLASQTEPKTLPSTIAAYRFPFESSAQAYRPNFKGLYHYKNMERIPVSKPRIQLMTAAPVTRRPVTQSPTVVASVSLIVRTTATPPTTTTIPASTWLPVFPPDLACGKNQFKCPSGVSRVPCLWDWERCDGIPDCSDGSDEAFCGIHRNMLDALQCYGNFRCDSGECVSLAKACNGIPDCADGSDEGERCPGFQCQSYELRCPSGYCIPSQWRCDGDADCPDHSDEVGCASSCGADEFMCPEGWCVPRAWRCNGIHDCSGGEDEAGCDTCEGGFRCVSGECLGAGSLCDGRAQCGDGSDEWDCLRRGEGQVVEVRMGESEWAPVCGDRWDLTTSHQFCQGLGLGQSESHQTLRLHNQSSLATLEFNSGPLLSRVKRISPDTCRSGIVAVQCAPAACGIWHSTDASGDSGDIHSRVKRIVGGHVSGSVQWPSVGVMLHGRQSWLCTVSLIQDRWLVTSALCVSRTDPLPDDWTIFLGSAQPNESRPEEVTVRRPLRFVRHPNYKFRSQLADFDVLLIQLDRGVGGSGGGAGEGGKVAPICLPPTRPSPPSFCLTAGWGYTNPGGYFLNKQLRHLEMVPGSLLDCNSTQHYGGLLSQRHLCAQNEGPGRQEPCFNDEGGPLMCVSESGSWEVRGVLSGQSCGSGRRHPAVFTDLAPFAPWIRHVISS